MASSQQQQYRTSGGAGVGGSYGPISSDADTRCKTALSTDNSLKPQAGSMAGAQAGASGLQDQPGVASGQQQDPSPDSQAGDASGISRTSGGAGVGGSYGPAVMAEAAKRTAQHQGGEQQDTAVKESGAEQAQQRSKL